MSSAFSDARIHSFPHVWCNQVKNSCQENGLPDEIVPICLAQEKREMYP
jgi:hypothetical protein